MLCDYNSNHGVEFQKLQRSGTNQHPCALFYRLCSFYVEAAC
jgi:hypothetical protein